MTKRFGIVAASQLPLHYLLAVKSWSPIQYLTRMSHEELNPYHRLLGRIIIAFFCAHAALYANFYIQSNLLHRFGSQTVILGLTAITTFLLLGTSSLAKIRDYSYLLFFVLHIVLSVIVLPVLWFHVSHLRIYIVESALIYILLIAQRKISQKPILATLSLHPLTSDSRPLVSISFPIPRSKLHTYKPGQHIYLSLPPTDLFKPWETLRFNPYTIASTSILPAAETLSTTASTEPTTPNTKTLTATLLIRPLRSATARLASLAQESNGKPVPVNVEGPYGSATYFPDFASSDFSRILLVAGGVGATFTLPIYRDLMVRRGGRGVKMVWAVRRVEEARALLEDGNGVEVWVTGDRNVWRGRAIAEHRSSKSEPEEIELEERAGLLGGAEESDPQDDPTSADDRKDALSDVKQGRPSASAIADEVFESDFEGGKVAVLVCGPAGMGRELRREVGRWVKRGRDVFWHEEEFSW